MKKNDIILMLIVLVIAVVAFIGFKISSESNQGDLEVLIKHDGEIIKSYPFSPKTNETYIYEEDGELNIIQIKDGIVNMIEANCRDQICVKTAAISRNGEIIVCLPHKLTVEIFSETVDNDGLDSIAD
jgi:hypothetical protein